jgi:plasmid stability protein
MALVCPWARLPALDLEAILDMSLETGSFPELDELIKRMGVLVQIRDVPESVHRALKSRAAAAGMSFSEYLRTLLARAAERPAPEELAARIRARGAVQRHQPSEESVRRLRDRGE